jgi:pilus assembly protein CpaF
MRDGVRRVSEIAEVSGMEEEVITLGSLFRFKFKGESQNGTLKGSFESTPSRPRFLARMEYFGLADEFREALGAGLEEAET